jgi:hypothetical protein
MKPNSALSLALLSAGLALSFSQARADDASGPPVSPPAPSSPDTSPENGAPPPPRHRHPPRGFVLGELTAKLNLTSAQQKTVGGILQSEGGQLKELRADQTLSQEDKRAKMQEIRQSTRAQIRAALTPAQQAIFDTLPANGGWQGRPQAPGAVPPAPTPPPSS